MGRPNAAKIGQVYYVYYRRETTQRLTATEEFPTREAAEKCAGDFNWFNQDRTWNRVVAYTDLTIEEEQEMLLEDRENGLMTADAANAIDMPDCLHNVLDDRLILTVANLLQSMSMLDEARFQQALGTITPALPAATLALLNAATWPVLQQSLIQLIQRSAEGSWRSPL